MPGFPATVNERAAGTVAALVALLTGAHPLLVPIALGFWARVLTGPRLGPLARVATRVVAPPKEVAGPTKRVAQGLGERAGILS